MWFDRQCCGGLVLSMFLLCVAIGTLFVLFSVTVPGLVFIAAGVATQGLCLLLGRLLGGRHCRQRYARDRFGG